MRLIVKDEKNPVFDYKILEKYHKDIKKYPTFKNKEEELECARRAVKGCEKAKEEMILRNLKFVVKVATQYSTHPKDVLDLISEGNRGLHDAIQQYDPEKGYKFISFAVWHIRRRIIDYLCEHSRVVKIPRNIAGLSKKIQAEEGLVYCQNDGYVPESFYENYEKYYESVRFNPENMISLDSEVRNDNNKQTVWSSVADYNVKEQHEVDDEQANKILVSRLIDTLTPSERELIVLTFGLDQDFPLSIHQVADRITFESKEGIKRYTEGTLMEMRRKVITKLRKRLNESQI